MMYWLIMNVIIMLMTNVKKHYKICTYEFSTDRLNQVFSNVSALLMSRVSLSRKMLM